MGGLLDIVVVEEMLSALEICLELKVSITTSVRNASLPSVHFVLLLSTLLLCFSRTCDMTSLVKVCRFEIWED